MFYRFRQNNSGGNFRVDKSRGIGHLVVIEANSYDEACKKARDIGLYFNGVQSGRDCDCCGDRWSSYTEESDIPLEERPDNRFNSEFFIHYANGIVENFSYQDQNQAEVIPYGN